MTGLRQSTRRWEDAYLEALAEHAFGQMAFPIRGPDWRENLLAWLRTVQEHVYRHPAVAKTIGWDGRVPAAWFRGSVFVIDELQSLGLRGEALVFALNWFMSSVIGLLLVEAQAQAYRQQLDLGMLDRLPPAAQETLLSLRREMASGRSHSHSGTRVFKPAEWPGAAAGYGTGALVHSDDVAAESATRYSALAGQPRRHLTCA
jgi:hypothetical protein